MKTTTLTLAAFLEARLAEDHERSAFVQSQIEGRSAAYEPWRLSWHDEYDLLCVEPSRALAEVAAKRAIMAEHLDWDGECSQCRGEEIDEWTRASWPCPTLRIFAAVYSDHPDYDESWRP